MAQISDWIAPRPYWTLYIAFIALFAMMTLLYYACHSSRDITGTLFLASLAAIVAGLAVMGLLPVVQGDLKKRERASLT